ncbi:hypothetical protein A8708_27055 [Paenibacillus oryzisoli]|uniref:Uncharacterized protein n=1 Tax=Paenibacillus oryzisoli TaxID=1850517 RepID=A0A198ABW3_9BACL|nr:hypothetical protein A8708_27055 [Paenibacillus oryzisoli]
MIASRAFVALVCIPSDLPPIRHSCKPFQVTEIVLQQESANRAKQSTLPFLPSKNVLLPLITIAFIVETNFLIKKDG